MAEAMQGVETAAPAPTKGKVDYGKIEADIEEQAVIARQVRAQTSAGPPADADGT